MIDGDDATVMGERVQLRRPEPGVGTEGTEEDNGVALVGGTEFNAVQNVSHTNQSTCEGLRVPRTCVWDTGSGLSPAEIFNDDVVLT